jgi:hypothetical protein
VREQQLLGQMRWKSRRRVYHNHRRQLQLLAPVATEAFRLRLRKEIAQPPSSRAASIAITQTRTRPSTTGGDTTALLRESESATPYATHPCRASPPASSPARPPAPSIIGTSGALRLRPDGPFLRASTSCAATSNRLVFATPSPPSPRLQWDGDGDGDDYVMWFHRMLGVVTL